MTTFDLLLIALTVLLVIGLVWLFWEARNAPVWPDDERDIHPYDQEED